MTLQEFFYLTVSTAAVVAIILGITIVVTLIYVRSRLVKLFDKVERLTNTTGKMAAEMKDFVHTTAERIIAMEKVFLTAQGMGKIAGFIGDAIKKSRGKRKKNT